MDFIYTYVNFSYAYVNFINKYVLFMDVFFFGYLLMYMFLNVFYLCIFFIDAHFRKCFISDMFYLSIC